MDIAVLSYFNSDKILKHGLIEWLLNVNNYPLVGPG